MIYDQFKQMSITSGIMHIKLKEDWFKSGRGDMDHIEGIKEIFLYIWD